MTMPEYEIDEDTVPEVVGPVPTGPIFDTNSNHLLIPRNRFPSVAAGTNVVLEEEDGPKRYTATVVGVTSDTIYLDVDWTSPIEVVDPEADVW